MGWHSFDQSLLKAFTENLISEEIAITYCSNKARMRRDLDHLGKVNGTRVGESHSGLKLSAVKSPPSPPARPRPVAPDLMTQPPKPVAVKS
ncbi:MAG: hypothetical protein H0X40_10925 [Chthoniobacterales bacterium]|nr:hypothetical protein [Chthoniobacterales bacterium]